MMKTKATNRNKSGCVGVCFSKNARHWLAYISIRKKRLYLGRFLHKDDAIKARKEAEKTYFPMLLKEIAKKEK